MTPHKHRSMLDAETIGKSNDLLSGGFWSQKRCSYGKQILDVLLHPPYRTSVVGWEVFDIVQRTQVSAAIKRSSCAPLVGPVRRQRPHAESCETICGWQGPSPSEPHTRFSWGWVDGKHDAN